MVLLIGLLLALLMALPAEATTYYASTTGSDSNNGTDTSTPFRTVDHCVSVLVAGDTCLVRGGNYSEGVIRFGRTGTQAAPIKLMAYPNEYPKITFIQPELPTLDRILIQNFSGANVAIGWITIEGFELTNGHDGIKYYNLHDSVIRRNWIHHNGYQGILGHGLRLRIEQNTFNHNGRFAACEAGTTTLCHHDHGIYAHGQYYTIVRNVFYDNIGYGIQQNGSSTSLYDPSKHASTEFAGASNWVISDNTFAYEYNAAGIVVWGALCTNARIENNIFYENMVTNNGEPQGVKCTSCSPSTGVSIRNNHFYASGSGGTAAMNSSAFNADLVTSGNVINVSAPAFVNGGTNSLPASPDFRLTASAPVNIALTNEFLNNSTNVVGAYKTIANPTASISANKITLTFPMNTAVPIQVSSATGVSVNCTGAACPGSPTVGSAGPKAGGTDSQAEVAINGCTGDNCAAGAQNWTISYNSATGSWTGYDNIGPYPGLHQKIFSFTNIAVTNIDTGGPPSGVGTPLIAYNFDEGTGTTLTNTGSSGAADNGTLTNGPTWVTGKTGTAVLAASGTTQKVDVPYGSGVNPTTQSLTMTAAVYVPSGSTSATMFPFGPDFGTNQRAYVCAHAGTWKVSLQSVTCSATAASNLTVTAGWNYLTLIFNSSTDVATLYKDGVTGTGGATGSYTSFTFASDITLGRLNGNNATGLTVDDFALYTTVEDASALYNAWNAPAVAVGTFGMPSYRFQAVYLPELGGSPTNFGTAINQTKTVIAGGAVALLAEIYCENVADCEQDGFRWEARHTNTLPFTASDSWIQIPDMETDTHIWMWGPDNNTLLNSGTTTSRLSAGSCTVTNGVTLLTSAQVPVVDLQQDGCVVLRGIFRIGATASGYYDIRLSQQSGTAFTGTVNPARITVIPPQANAGP